MASGIEPGPTRYADPRAHALRERYIAAFGGPEIPVPVESIAKDLLSLRIEETDLGDCSGMLIPASRLIRVSAAEAMSGETPVRRHRFTVAHELGHWICHATVSRKPAPTYCRATDLAQDAERDREREANVFAAELLMPEAVVRSTWAELSDVARAAARLDVSQSAMGWRLFNLGLVAEKPE
jgi:IrrE N-terminal-like domain